MQCPEKHGNAVLNIIGIATKAVLAGKAVLEWIGPSLHLKRHNTVGEHSWEQCQRGNSMSLNNWWPGKWLHLTIEWLDGHWVEPKSLKKTVIVKNATDCVDLNGKSSACVWLTTYKSSACRESSAWMNWTLCASKAITQWENTHESIAKVETQCHSTIDGWEMTPSHNRMIGWAGCIE